MHQHQFSYSESLKANAPLKRIPSDHSSPTFTSYSSSKLVFDVNKFQIEEFHTNNLRKQTICDGTSQISQISQYNISQKQSHSEITYPHTTSESYQCLYLSDDNNQELIVDIDENCKKQIINNKEIIIYENHFEYNSPKNSIHSTEDEQNSFYLFNDYQSSSDDEYETKMESKYKINVPTIAIPKSKKEFISPTRPAFKLHLEMVDDDGSIKRQIIKHRKRCQRHNMKQTSNKSDKIRNKLKKRKKKRKKKKYMRSFRHLMSNVVDYLVTENTRDLNLTVSIDNYYFID